MTRLFGLILGVWPGVAVPLVCAARRSLISRPERDFLKSLGLGQGICPRGPAAMLALFRLTGMVPAVATVYGIPLGIPIFAVPLLAVAVLFARDPHDARFSLPAPVRSRPASCPATGTRYRPIPP